MTMREITVEVNGELFRRTVAPRIRADGAGIVRVDIAAAGADDDALGCDAHRLGQRREQLLALLDEMQRRPPGRAGAEPGQAGEKLDETLDLGADG